VYALVGLEPIGSVLNSAPASSAVDRAFEFNKRLSNWCLLVLH